MLSIMKILIIDSVLFLLYKYHTYVYASDLITTAYCRLNLFDWWQPNIILALVVVVIYGDAPDDDPRFLIKCYPPRACYYHRYDLASIQRIPKDLIWDHERRDSDSVPVYHVGMDNVYS